MRRDELPFSSGSVESNRLLYEQFERFRIKLIALANIDRAPGSALELELNRPEGSLSEAPFAKVSFTLFLYISPVQSIPSCSHTGTPSGFEGLRHLTVSTTSGSACRIRARILCSILPRQSSFPSAIGTS